MRGETAKKFARRQSHIAHASHALRSPGKPRLISSLLKQRQFKIPTTIPVQDSTSCMAIELIYG